MPCDYLNAVVLAFRMPDAPTPLLGAPDRTLDLLERPPCAGALVNFDAMTGHYAVWKAGASG